MKLKLVALAEDGEVLATDTSLDTDDFLFQSCLLSEARDEARERHEG